MSGTPFSGIKMIELIQWRDSWCTAHIREVEMPLPLSCLIAGGGSAWPLNAQVIPEKENKIEEEEVQVRIGRGALFFSACL